MLDTLMEFVTVANGSAFHSALCRKLLLCVMRYDNFVDKCCYCCFDLTLLVLDWCYQVRSTSLATFVVDLLDSTYFKYIDVRYGCYADIVFVHQLFVHFT